MKIVLLHGWGCDSRIWQPIIPFFKHYGEIVLIDINEHIETALVNDQLSPNIIVSSIAKQLPEKSILCGWSLGGMLATQLAACSPEKVTALITLASNAVFVANEQWQAAMPAATFDQFFSLLKNSPRQALKRFRVLEVYGDENAKSQSQYLQSLANDSAIYEPSEKVLEAGLVLLASIDNTPIFEKITCPALYCFGENDTLVPVSAAAAIKAKVSVGQSITILEASGHLLHYPEEKILLLLESFFLSLVPMPSITLRANTDD